MQVECDTDLLIFASAYALMDSVISRWIPCVMIFVPPAAAAARAATSPPRRARVSASRCATSPDRAPKKAGDARAGARDPPTIDAQRADARSASGRGAAAGARAATAGDAETAKSDITCLVFSRERY